MPFYVKAGRLGRASRGLWSIDAGGAEILLEGPLSGFAEVRVKDSDIFNEVNVGDTGKVTHTEAVVADVFTLGAAKN